MSDLPDLPQDEFAFRERDTIAPDDVPTATDHAPPAALSREGFAELVASALEPRLFAMEERLEKRLEARLKDHEQGFGLAMQEMLANQRMQQEAIGALRDEMRPRINSHDSELAALRRENVELRSELESMKGTVRRIESALDAEGILR